MEQDFVSSTQLHPTLSNPMRSITCWYNFQTCCHQGSFEFIYDQTTLHWTPSEC